MKAIVCEKYNSLEHLILKDVKVPSVNDSDIMIQTIFSTVSSGDSVVRKASNPFMRLVFGFRKPRRSVLGTEVAGVVTQIGGNVTNFKVGNRVVASLGMKFGGHGEYVVTKQDSAVVKIPSSLSMDEAIAFPFGGCAALHFLKQMNLQKGSKLLVYGSSGAVGTAAIQLAKSMGFEVTAVCSGKNFGLMKELGFCDVVDYQQNGWKKQFGTFDYIFDAVGVTRKSDWKDHVEPDCFYSIANGMVKETKEDLEYLMRLASKGTIKPVIDTVYTVDNIREAYIHVESKRKKGNVLLDFQVKTEV